MHCERTLYAVVMTDQCYKPYRQITWTTAASAKMYFAAQREYTEYMQKYIPLGVALSERRNWVALLRDPLHWSDIHRQWMGALFFAQEEWFLFCVAPVEKSTAVCTARKEKLHLDRPSCCTLVYSTIGLSTLVYGPDTLRERHG